MDKMDHLMAKKNENNKDSQKGQVTPKNYFKKRKSIITKFQDVELHFSYQEPISSNCTTNCTYQTINGTFRGLSYASWHEVQAMASDNMYGGYGRDCESRDATVSFMTVFGVLFSGVSFPAPYMCYITC
jgi:hypothetical protein